MRKTPQKPRSWSRWENTFDESGTARERLPFPGMMAPVLGTPYARPTTRERSMVGVRIDPSLARWVKGGKPIPLFRALVEKSRNNRSRDCSTVSVQRKCFERHASCPRYCLQMCAEGRRREGHLQLGKSLRLHHHVFCVRNVLFSGTPPTEFNDSTPVEGNKHGHPFFGRTWAFPQIGTAIC